MRLVLTTLVVACSLPSLILGYGPPVKGGAKKPSDVIPANLPPPTEEFTGSISTCGPSCAAGSHTPAAAQEPNYAQNPFLNGGISINSNTPTGSVPHQTGSGGIPQHQGSQSNNNPNYANNPFLNQQQGCAGGSACGGSQGPAPQGPVHSQGPSPQGPVHSQGPAPQAPVQGGNYGNNPFLTGNQQQQQGCSGSACGNQGPPKQEGNYANNPFLSGSVSQTSCTGAACGGQGPADYSQNPFLSGQGQAPPQQQGGVVCQAGSVCISSRICNNGYVNPNNLQQAKQQGSPCNVAAGEVCCSVTSRNDGPGLVHVQPAPGSSKPGLVHVSPSNNAPGFINPASGGTIRNPVTQRPQFSTTYQPYTGPQNVTPHPGCPAALKCVKLEFCTWEGVMSNVPVALTREENESRVPLTECANLEEGFVGKCCRDPNYKDPWPDMLPGGGCYPNTQCEVMERCDNDRMAMPKATCNLVQQGGVGICCHSRPGNNFVQQPNNQQSFNQIKPVQPVPQQPGFPNNGRPTNNPGFVNKPNPTYQQQQPAFPARPIVNPPPQNTGYAPQNTGFPPKPNNPGFVNPPQNTGFPPKPNNPTIPQQQVVPSNPNPGFAKPDYQQQIDKIDNLPPVYEQGTAQQPIKTEIIEIEISGAQPQNPNYTPQTEFFQTQAPVGGSSYPKPQPKPQNPSFGQQQPQNQFNQPKPQNPPHNQFNQPKPQNPSFGQQPQNPSFGQQPQNQFNQPKPQNPSFVQQPQQFGENQIPPFNQPETPKYEPQPEFGGSQNGLSLIPPQYPGLSSQASPGQVCGVRRVSQVSGLQGQDGQTVPGEFPWMALVVLPSNNTRLCAGALISEKAVLCSAHCVLGLNPSDLQVEVGSWSPYESNPERQSAGVVAVARHPKFEAGSLGSDLAVILLAVPFRLGQHVDTVCLPEQNQIGPDGELRNPGGACVMSSWPKQAGPEGYLHRVAMSSVPKGQCEESLRQTYLGKYFQLNRSFMCAKPVDPQQDICSVGLGGPLVCPQQDGRYVLTGASSWDVGCSERRTPSVLCALDVAWVNEVMARPVEDFIAHQAPIQHVVDPSVANKKPGFSQGYGK